MYDRKMLLIFPPQWTPISPHFAIPSLTGQLKEHGFNVQAFDLNIEFFNDILTENYLKQSIEKIECNYGELRKKILKIFSPNKKANEYTVDEQILLYKYNKITKYLQTSRQNFQYIPQNIDIALKVIRSEDFYNPAKIIPALNIIDRALEIVSLPYLPTKIEFEGVSNPFFKFSYESIKKFVLDEKSNIFSDYYKKHLKKIIDGNYDYIAISLNSSSQIIAGLTLTYILKKKTKAHICIGGNFFGRIANELKNHKEFFKLFTDSVAIEEGEGPIVEIGKFVNGVISIEQVPNFMYLKDDIVCINDKMKPVKLDNMANMDISDYDLTKYFTPKIVMPYQSSRGCYWGKCSFCDQDFGQNFNVKNASKVISEFKEFNEKYGIKDFEFIDESVSPSYLRDLSKQISEENIDVKFFMDARLETEFTKDVLDLGHKAGLQMIMWGLESGSKKVLELINKGIDLDKRFEILANAKDVGIWNFAFIFFGFPTETLEDAKLTVKMLVDNKDIIHSYGRSVFTMGRHSKLAAAPEKYGITKIYPAEDDFSPNIKFDAIGQDNKNLKDILNYCLIECSKAYKNPLWMYLRYREWLFLYISKYGSDWVKNCIINLKAGA